MEILAALEPSPFPVISLYLSLTANQTGREEYGQFVRKVFSERGKALAADSPARASFEQDADRIRSKTGRVMARRRDFRVRRRAIV